jgi:hypothetical protein
VRSRPAAGLREALAALGPFFAVASPEGVWLPLADLLDAAAVADRVHGVRQALGGDAVPVRVAASVAQLGLVGRLLGPVIGAAVLDSALLPVGQLQWRPAIGGPLPLALPDDALDAAREQVPYDQLVTGLGELLEGPVAALVELAAAHSVSRKVLWGNVASAVNGAVTMVAAHPDLRARATTLGDDLLRLPVLGHRSTGATATTFKRRSCCLLYRLATPGTRQICGDCVLDRA